MYMRHNKVCFVPIRSTMWRFCWCERWSVSVKQATALRRQLSSPIYSLITTERLPWLCSSSLYLSAGALYLLIVIAVLYLELLAINKVYEHLITAESRLLTYVTIWSFFSAVLKPRGVSVVFTRDSRMVLASVRLTHSAALSKRYKLGLGNFYCGIL